VSKIVAALIMGGVLTDQPPLTTPPSPNILNRFSSATMNQLYHPQNAADFFSFLEQFKIPTLVITNNAVGDLTTFDAENRKTDNGILSFMSSNDLKGPFLQRMALAHYNSPYNPSRKPFDFYTAVALREFMAASPNPERGGGRLLIPRMLNRRTGSGRNFSVPRPEPPQSGLDDSGQIGEQADNGFKVMFYSNVYGITCVSKLDTWEAARDQYISNIDLAPSADDSELAKARKSSFRKEVELMRSIGRISSMGVVELRFTLNSQSWKLDVETESSGRR
jgi:hypothetical protein